VECNVQGVSGWKVGGAGAVGSWAGSQIGKGSGNVVATIIGAVVGSGATYFAEDSRIERDREQCLKQIEYRRRQQEEARNYMPSNNPNAATLSSLILYTFIDNRTGQQQIVTMQNSPGVAALKGIRSGGRDINSDPMVLQAFTQAFNGLEESYRNYENAAARYISVKDNTRAATRADRYSLDRSDTPSQSGANHRQVVQQAAKDLKDAGVRQAQNMSYAAAVFDNMADDGYALSSYGYILDKFQAPPNVNQACDCRQPHQYSTVPPRLTADR